MPDTDRTGQWPRATYRDPHEIGARVLLEARALARGPTWEETLTGHAKQILLVDDEVGLRQLLFTTLSSPQFTIMQATSGDEALALARSYHPDLVILDLRLTPEQPDGLEVCRRLKAAPATADIRILMLTAATQPEDREAAQRAGADYYFTKPFSPLALLERIYAVLLNR